MDFYTLFSTPETHRLVDFCVGAFLSITTLVQISPLKINPWDKILGWVGKGVNREIRDEISGIQAEVASLKKSVDEIWVSEHRRKILTFARECRRETAHSIEEWRFIIATMEEYENYCRRNCVDNGVIKEDSAYVRELYHQLLREHKL